MMKPMLPKDIPAVMARFTVFLMEEDEEAQQLWCDSLNDLFDEAQHQDAFGTEGQLDPRGDR